VAHGSDSSSCLWYGLAAPAISWLSGSINVIVVTLNGVSVSVCEALSTYAYKYDNRMGMMPFHTMNGSAFAGRPSPLVPTNLRAP
jgi:hypothetical protein